MTDDIKKKAEEWIELNKSDYEGYGDPDCEDYEPEDLERGMKAAYLAGAKERDKWWAERWIAYIDSIRPNVTQSFDVIQSMVDELNQASKEALEES